MSKFQKGDKVRVRRGLECGGNCDGLGITSGMVALEGKILEIVEIDCIGNYLLDDCSWWWSDEMLEPVEDGTDTNVGTNVNRCASCGAEIPEGRQVCWACENGQEPHIKDSGERTEYASGAVRDCKEGKGRCDLMPLDAWGRYFRHKNRHEEYRFFARLWEFKRNGDVEKIWDALDGAFPEMRSDKGICEMVLEVSKHFEEGAKKYGENNWQKGIPIHSYIDSAIRHYMKYRAGWKDEPHDRALVWNLLCCVWTMTNHPELDDWTEKKSEE